MNANTANQQFNDRLRQELVRMLHEHLVTKCSTDQILELNNGVVAYLNHQPRVENGASKACGRIKVVIGGGHYVVIWTNKNGASGLAGKPTWYNTRKHSVDDLLLEMTEKLVGKGEVIMMAKTCFFSRHKEESKKLFRQDKGTPCLDLEAFTPEELTQLLTLPPFINPVNPVEYDGIRIENGEVSLMGQPCTMRILAKLVSPLNFLWVMKHLYPNFQALKDHRVVLSKEHQDDWIQLAGDLVSAMSECRLYGITIEQAAALAA